jgi:hypothetical protein
MPEINIPDFENTELFTLLDPGVYTFNIQEPPLIEPAKSSGKPKLVFKAVVVDGPPQKTASGANGNNPAGKMQFVSIPLELTSVLKSLLIATGLLIRNDKTSPMAKGQFNSDILVGTTFRATLEPNTYNGNESRKIGKYLI